MLFWVTPRRPLPSRQRRPPPQAKIQAGTAPRALAHSPLTNSRPPLLPDAKKRGDVLPDRSRETRIVADSALVIGQGRMPRSRRHIAHGRHSTVLRFRHYSKKRRRRSPASPKSVNQPHRHAEGGERRSAATLRRDGHLRKSTDVRNAFLDFCFRGGNRLRRKLEHRCFLTFQDVGQQHHLPIRKFQRIMMRSSLGPHHFQPRSRCLLGRDNGPLTAATSPDTPSLSPGREYT
jgi:hypothetical protein